VFAGNDDCGGPTPVSRTVPDALDAWLETHTPTWAASTVRDQTSRVALVKTDKIARSSLGHLAVVDVDRWHTRQRSAGVGERIDPAAGLAFRLAAITGARRSERERYGPWMLHPGSGR